MEHARPLPDYLVARYRAWQARRSPEDLRPLRRGRRRARARRR